MPVPFVLVDGPLVEDATVGLDDATERHLRKVLRLGDDATVEVTDGDGAVASGALTADGVRVLVAPERPARPEPPVEVVHALPKGRKLDEVVRVLTELGVDAVHPVMSQRSVVRLEGDRAQRARERWQAVADAALSQSRRPWRCRIGHPVALDAWLAVAQAERGVVAHVGADVPLRDVVDRLVDGQGPVVVAIGPEGGWTSDEIVGLEQRGLASVSVGRTVLRTEHAASVVTALVSYVLGRLG